MEGISIDSSSPSGLSRNGKPLGSLKKSGYYELKIKGKMYMAHRLVYSLFHSMSLEEMKGLVIDHLDGDKANNHPDNLRLVTVRANAQNRKEHRKGKLVGTSFAKSCNLWKAQVQVKGEIIGLGYHKTEQKAHEAYAAYCKEHNLI